jgi:hypothetical protein
MLILYGVVVIKGSGQLKAAGCAFLVSPAPQLSCLAEPQSAGGRVAHYAGQYHPVKCTVYSRGQEPAQATSRDSGHLKHCACTIIKPQFHVAQLLKCKWRRSKAVQTKLGRILEQTRRARLVYAAQLVTDAPNLNANCRPIDCLYFKLACGNLRSEALVLLTVQPGGLRLPQCAAEWRHRTWQWSGKTCLQQYRWPAEQSTNFKTDTRIGAR